MCPTSLQMSKAQYHQKELQEEGIGGYTVMEGVLTWGGEHTIQYTDDIL